MALLSSFLLLIALTFPLPINSRGRRPPRYALALSLVLDASLCSPGSNLVFTPYSDTLAMQSGDENDSDRHMFNTTSNARFRGYSAHACHLCDFVSFATRLASLSLIR